ncbi:MAG TPA: hypothetical protein VKG43_00650 [Acidimicrobiales bacterium]|nr:hypothetical protein [Acidimicrobiales bacterium]
MLSDDDLASMSREERRALARRLAHFTDVRPGETPASRRTRRIFFNILVLSCIVLIPWIALLAGTLPRRYIAGNWTAAWVGFDIALLLGLAVTAWGALRRRQVVILASLMTGTLLVVDAWFDVTTASTNRDRMISIATAVLAELPLAALLFYITHRLIRATTRETLELAGSDDPNPPFWKAPLFALSEPGQEPTSVPRPVPGPGRPVAPPRDGARHRAPSPHRPVASDTGVDRARS